MTTDTIRAARPTINIGGQDNASLAEGLLSLLISETVSGLYHCEAVFGNWGTVNGQLDFLYFDRRTLDFGKAFKIKLGSQTIFEGRIMGLEAQFPQGDGPKMAVLAEDRFQDLRMTRRTRTFQGLNDAGVISQIAGEYGLTAAVSLTGPTYKLLAQVNQSDLAFLRERARAVDAEIWMDGLTLHAQTHTDRNGGSLELTYGDTLHEFSVLADLAGQRTSVAVSGWDVASKAVLKQEVTAQAISGELGRDTSGVSILQSAVGPRKESLVHTVPLNTQEAQTQAETFFKLSARRFVVGQGRAEADSRLRVGSYVNLKGLGPLFNGKYYLSEVRHLFDGVHGIRSEFVAERPGIGS